MMNGPVALFDKSFLQGLSVDESVWFDNFFLAVVTPYFFVETLADLEKETGPRVSPEQLVRRIAQKFPQLRGTPCAFHRHLMLAELLGDYRVPMNGQIPIAGGRPVASGEDTGVVYPQSPEAEAFSRWSAGEFREQERTQAGQWRDSLSSYDVSKVAQLLREAGVDVSSCRSLHDVKRACLQFTSHLSISSDPLRLAMGFAGATGELGARILARNRHLGSPRLSAFAPYAYYIVTVETFYVLAVGAGLISPMPSALIDLAYLFYLPFSMVFVSSDRLHERLAPYFLREDQKFLWGPDLKGGLRELDQHYRNLPQGVRETGVMQFAHWPPVEFDSLVGRIFDEHLPGWRERASSPARNVDPEAEKRLVEKLKKLSNAPEVRGDSSPGAEHRFVSIQRRVSKKRGSWYQVPKDLETDTE